MADLAEALAEAGGVDAPPQRTAQLRSLLGAELQRGRAELDLRRSGYERPVVVAVGAAPPDAPPALLAAVPADPAFRADPDAAGERAWRLTAAVVGALVDAGAAGELLAGAVDGALLVQIAGGGDPELAVLAFEDHAEGIDRLRACALALPPGVLHTDTDLSAPVGPAHPLTVALEVARLGGRPADPEASEALEEAVLAALGVRDDTVARPHEDPDPKRRVARRILQRLDGMGKWGGYHTEFAHLARGFAPADRERAAAVGERLLKAGLLSEKPSVGQRHVFLNPRRAGDIRALIDDGQLPDDLKLL
jgi:hypothetical protein